ncbi:hypothetical protein [Polaribacter sp.]|uniref:hypothetical protein n=1 Tax=Polaribacter sp. TaxID=1920175 RepID=UPI003EF77352
MKPHYRTNNILKYELSNSDGEVDNRMPFTPFGPIPEIGTFFKISSKEWLNKNISEININIFWNKESLPKDFLKYYADYPNIQGLDHEFFKVKINTSQNRQSSALLNDHSFNLFQVNKKKAEISYKSEFRLRVGENIDFTNYFEGIYIILIEPDWGFGNAIFPQLFSEVVLENNRWLNRLLKRQLQLPNPPYIPIVDKIEIVYTYLKQP